MAKDKLREFEKPFRAKTLPDVKPGDVVRIAEKIKEEGKERKRVFEGLVIARKHGKGPSATIKVRKISFGVGVEKTYPLHSPIIGSIEVIKRTRVRRAKLYYIRKQLGKKVRRRKELPVPQIGKADEEKTEETQRVTTS